MSFAYRDRPGPLQAARAGAAFAWSQALLLAAMLFLHPVALGATLVVALIVGWRCRVLRQLLTVLMLALPFGAIAAAINALITREGVTVVFEAGQVPWFGRLDITWEAIVFGAVLGFKLVVVFVVAMLYTLVVDPDKLLRLMRRLSVRSALAASLATRLVPVLAADGARLRDAQRSRPGDPGGIRPVLHATFSRAFERADELGAALETRGFSLRSHSRAIRAPWSRQDIAAASSAVALLLASVGLRALDVMHFDAYPRLEVESSGAIVVGALALIATGAGPLLMPSLRRGLERRR